MDSSLVPTVGGVLLHWLTVKTGTVTSYTRLWPISRAVIAEAAVAAEAEANRASDVADVRDPVARLVVDEVGLAPRTESDVLPSRVHESVHISVLVLDLDPSRLVGVVVTVATRIIVV